MPRGVAALPQHPTRSARTEQLRRDLETLHTLLDGGHSQGRVDLVEVCSAMIEERRHELDELEIDEIGPYRAGS